MRTLRRTLAATVIAVLPCVAAGQAAVIVGRVLDSAERPLAGATVVFEDEITSVSDHLGVFTLRIDFVDSGLVSFRKVGFAPALASVHLARGDTLRLTARLASATLDTVRATARTQPSARLAAFEARRASGRGTFVTRAEIEKRGPATAADAIRWTGAIYIVDGRLPVSQRGTQNDRIRKTLDAPCVMRLAVDGQLYPLGSGLETLPSPSEIEGIEIFKGPAMLPSEFKMMGPDSFCGLVSVWTRAR